MFSTPFLEYCRIKIDYIYIYIPPTAALVPHAVATRQPAHAGAVKWLLGFR